MKFQSLVDLVTFYSDMVGVPYKWGGRNPVEGFDCSGLMLYPLIEMGMFGRGFDTTAHGLKAALLKTGGFTPATPCAGAYVFFGKSESVIGHCGFCLDDHTMIEAYGDRIVTDHTSAANYNAGRGAFVRRASITRRKDLVAYVYPKYPWG